MKIVCATAVRNEGWILEQFLELNSRWADAFAIRYQESTDETLEILNRYDNVSVFEASNDEFDEAVRRQELIDHARTLNPTVIVSLDADEILIGDLESRDWREAIRSDPGTVLAMRWPHYVNGSCWTPPGFTRFGIVDDGRNYQEATRIHTPRIPEILNEQVTALASVRVFHLQYLPLARNRAKQRYYQCIERTLNEDRSCIDIYRQYSHSRARDRQHCGPLSSEEVSLVQHIENALSDVADAGQEFNRDVEFMFDAYGPQRFVDLNIWDEEFVELGVGAYSRKRLAVTRMTHAWLSQTAGMNKVLAVRVVDWMLKRCGL